MKKKDKKYILLCFIILSSFLVGSIITLLLFNLTKKEDKEIDLNKLSKSVVYIETKTNDIKDSNGSGFVYKKDSKYAYIITNEHVILGEDVYITTSSNKELKGEVLGKDPYLDIAVVRVNKKDAPKSIELVSSKFTAVGEDIYTIGTPVSKNYLNTITKGILTGKDRLVKTAISEDENIIIKSLQFDATINPGNSGGPLINSEGKVIGVITMKLIQEDIEGMSFATPIEEVISIVKKLEEQEEIKRPDIGASLIDIVEADISAENIIKLENISEGVVITELDESGDATKAGLKVGDIIVEVNNTKTKDMAYFNYEINNSKEKDKLNIKYLRDGEYKTTTLVITNLR